jgi:hypothetical protein
VAEGSGDELPVRSADLIGVYEVAHGGLAVLVGEVEVGFVAADGGVLGGISLGAPRPEEA